MYTHTHTHARTHTCMHALGDDFMQVFDFVICCVQAAEFAFHHLSLTSESHIEKEQLLWVIYSQVLPAALLSLCYSQVLPAALLSFSVPLCCGLLCVPDPASFSPC